MSETRWILWRTGDDDLDATLGENGSLRLTLAVASEDPELVAAIEGSARDAGLELTRLLALPESPS